MPKIANIPRLIRCEIIIRTYLGDCVDPKSIIDLLGFSAGCVATLLVLLHPLTLVLRQHAAKEAALRPTFFVLSLTGHFFLAFGTFFASRCLLFYLFLFTWCGQAFVALEALYYYVGRWIRNCRQEKAQQDYLKQVRGHDPDPDAGPSGSLGGLFRDGGSLGGDRNESIQRREQDGPRGRRRKRRGGGVDEGAYEDDGYRSFEPRRGSVMINASSRDLIHVGPPPEYGGSSTDSTPTEEEQEEEETELARPPHAKPTSDRCGPPLGTVSPHTRVIFTNILFLFLVVGFAVADFEPSPETDPTKTPTFRAAIRLLLYWGAILSVLSSIYLRLSMIAHNVLAYVIRALVIVHMTFLMSTRAPSDPSDEGGNETGMYDLAFGPVMTWCVGLPVVNILMAIIKGIIIVRRRRIRSRRAIALDSSTVETDDEEESEEEEEEEEEGEFEYQHHPLLGENSMDFYAYADQQRSSSSDDGDGGDGQAKEEVQEKGEEVVQQQPAKDDEKQG